jgi:LCP family protein required for cell wall assembly
MSRRPAAYPRPYRRGDDTELYRTPRRSERGAYRVGAPPRRRRHRWGRTLALALLILLIAAAVVALMVFARVAAFNDRISSASAASSRLLAPLGPLPGNDRVNVAIIGYPGGDYADGTYLADSINILSINPTFDSTTTIAVPRDLWVEGIEIVPDAKVNEAHAVGWEESGGDPYAAGDLTAEVLESVTGLEIDGWISLDFSGFDQIIDAVGGVTIENPIAFRYTDDEERLAARDWDGEFPAGSLTLNGDDALYYVRARYTDVPEESSDFARSVRQQRVMAALRGELGNGLTAVRRASALMGVLDDHLRTNLSAIDLYLLSGHLTSDRRVELQEDVVIYATTNAIGQYILVVGGQAFYGDYAPLHDYLREALRDPAKRAP